MAKAKVLAPEGYHFMIKKNGNFYLQKGKYTQHTLDNGDRSSKSVMLEYSTEHPSKIVTGAATTATTNRSPRSNTPASTRISKKPNRTTSSRSTSGGGY